MNETGMFEKSRFGSKQGFYPQLDMAARQLFL
jgi:hypothetical protein